VNPIIGRELLEVMRTRKALVSQLLLALACAFLVLLRWPTEDVADLTGARSLQVLRMFGYGLLAGVLVLVPAFPATTLVREKIKGTLELLLNSPMRPWSIYVGKLGGVLGFTAILLLMTLPAAAACYALGGSGVRGGISMLYALLGIAALQMSTLGLLVSSCANSTDGALRATYLLVLAVSALPLLPHWLLQGRSDIFAEAAAWFRCLSPIPAVMEVLGQGDVGSQGLASASGAITRYAIMATLSSVVCALATLARLNHRLFDRARPAGVMTQDRSLGARTARRVFFVGFFDPQRRSGSMSAWVNPVMVKEFRSRRFGRSHWTMRLIALCAILSLGLTCIALTGALGWGKQYIGGGLVLLQIALLILFAPSLAAGMVSAERERGSWQLLRMTPLSVRSILLGKLASVVWPVLLLLCATVPGYVVLLIIEPEQLPRVQRVVACLALTAVFVVIVSAAASTFFRSTAASMTASYVALLTLCLGPLLVWLARDAPFGHATVEAVLLITPVAAALQASDMQGFNQYELLPLNWWIIGSACVALLVVLSLRTWRLFARDER
jgi:ABC-type transport system involved in multi-copper enzyme maturation permease subunit